MVTICWVMVTISMQVQYKQVTSITSGDKQQVTLTDVQCLQLFALMLQNVNQKAVQMNIIMW